MNLNREIVDLDVHLASITFNSTEGELKAQILIGKAGLLQAKVLNEQNVILTRTNALLQHIAEALGA
jgi:hypothetical protein